MSNFIPAPSTGSAPSVGAPEQSAPQNPRSPSAISILDLFRASTTQCEITAAGKSYVEALRRSFDENQTGIKIALHPDSVVARAVVTRNKLAIVLTFTENYTSVIPATENSVNFINELEASGVKVVDNIVVVAADYAYVEIMAAHLISVLRAPEVGAIDMTILSFANANNQVNTNVRTATDFARRFFPHAALPPCDIALTLLQPVPRKGANFNGNEEKEMQPILTVTAQTRFVTRNVNNMPTLIGGPKPIIPVVTITGVISPIKGPAIMTTAMILAAETFIKRGGWKQPYMTFGKDKPNIGNLIPDATGKPMELTDHIQVETFIANYCDAPYLAYDQVDGKARIPCSDMISAAPSEFIGLISRFLGTRLGDNAQLLSGAPTKEYIGTVDNGNIDSRTIDFLTLVAEGHMTADLAPTIFRLLHNQADPTARGRIITEGLQYRYKAEYCNNRCILHAGLVSQMASAMSNSGISVRWDNAAQIDNNLSVFDGGANVYNGMSPVNTVPGGFYSPSSHFYNMAGNGR
jgi:hypothetical protein